jgi:molybdenum cofactor cytidylyltransferase
MIFGLIPAGGKSERMGRSKLALRVGDKTVLEHVIKALRDGGADHVLVVLGPVVANLELVAKEARADVLVLSEQTAHMRATVEAGLDWLQSQYSPTPTDWWLLAPADHPAIDVGVVRQLVAVTESKRSSSIVVPTCRHQRGHPVLISWLHVAGIREFPPEHGLNVYLRHCATQVREMETSSPTILEDLDTPEDYQRLMEPS